MAKLPKQADVNGADTKITNQEVYWQDDLLNLKQRVEYVLSSKELSDVTFIVGCEPNIRSFDAHRFVLVISSPVFKAMFYGGLASDEKAVECVIKYIYTDRIEQPILTIDNAVKVIYLANKYAFINLEAYCVKFIFKNKKTMFQMFTFKYVQ